MALDSTLSGTAAESYLSVTDADARAIEFGLAGWAAKTTAQKETALRVATQEIDSHRFNSADRYAADQALQFPRGVDDGIVPREIKRALMYQAEWIAMAGDGDRKQWDGANAAPLSSTGNTSPLCPRAMNILAKFISRVGRFS